MSTAYRLLTIIALAGCCWPAPAAEVRISLTTEAHEVKRVQHGDYLLLGLPGATARAAVGEPAIPIKHVQVALPAGATVTGVTCSGAEEVFASDVLLLPRQPSHVLSEEAPPFVEGDPAVYGTDALWPGVRAGAGTSMRVRGRTVLTLRVAPLRYNPVTRTVLLAQNLEVCVHYEEAAQVQTEAASAITPHPVFDAMLRRSIANPDALPASTVETETASVQSVSTQAETIDYLVITNDALAEAFQALVDRRVTTHGYAGAVLTVADIEANDDYSGVDTPAKIRDCIDTYVQNHDTIMVVLGGDEEVVPVRRCYCMVDAFGIGLVGVSDLPADLYYSELDGDWNADGDDKWGEIGDDVDNFGWDVIVGRIPVRTVQNVQDYIAKLATLEDEEPGDLNDKFLMAGSPLGMAYDLEEGDTGLEMDRHVHEWDGLPSLYDSGRLRQDDEFWSRRLAYDFLADVYTPGTIAGLFSTVTSWDGSEPGDYGVSSAEIIDRFSEDWGLCYWFSHGSQYCFYTETEGDDGLKVFDRFEGHVDALTGHTAIFVTPACQAGRFDWTGHEDRDPCLSEALLRHPDGGAVIYHGSTRNGYGGDLDVYGGESPHFAGGFMRELATSADGQVGAAYAVSKAALADACQEYGFYRTLMFTINLQGDPAYCLPLGDDDSTRGIAIGVHDAAGAVRTEATATQDGATVYEDSAETHTIDPVAIDSDVAIELAPAPAGNNG